MKYFIAVLCLAQLVFSAPNEPATVIEQVQKNIATAQAQANTAVTELNTKVLAAAGVQNNQQLLTAVDAQAKTYAAQIKGVTDQISQKATEQKGAVDAMFTSILGQLASSASNLLGQQDPAKVEQLQGTFNNVLTQTKALQDQIETQGTAAQQLFADTLGKLYEQTVASAKNVAAQLDASSNRPQ